MDKTNKEQKLKTLEEQVTKYSEEIYELRTILTKLE